MFCVGCYYFAQGSTPELQNVNFLRRWKFEPKVLLQKRVNRNKFSLRQNAQIIISLLINQSRGSTLYTFLILGSNVQLHGANLPKWKGLFSLKNFAPHLETFYSDVSVISVTFCNSAVFYSYPPCLVKSHSSQWLLRLIEGQDWAVPQDDYIHIWDLNLFCAYIVFVPRARMIFWLYIYFLCTVFQVHISWPS